MTPTLVLGGGGLIGRAIRRALPGARRAVVRWGSAASTADIRTAVRLLADETGESGRWRIVWAAGRGVISSDETTLRAETEALGVVLTSTEAMLPAGREGRVTLISSAGGLYAGSDRPPFDEEAPVAPLTAYGREKAAQERLLAATAARSGIDAVAMRLGPVYGTGQDPTKAQGLVSALCRATVTRRPLRLYVPLDTRRPYLWAGDAGRIVAALATGPVERGGDLRIRTVPGGPAVTVQDLIGAVRRVTRRDPPILLAPGPEAARHARDLRLASCHPSETTLPDPTPLTVGIGLVWRAMLRDPIDTALSPVRRVTLDAETHR